MHDVKPSERCSETKCQAQLIPVWWARCGGRYIQSYFVGLSMSTLMAIVQWWTTHGTVRCWHQARYNIWPMSSWLPKEVPLLYSSLGLEANHFSTEEALMCSSYWLCSWSLDYRWLMPITQPLRVGFEWLCKSICISYVEMSSLTPHLTLPCPLRLAVWCIIHNSQSPSMQHW